VKRGEAAPPRDLSLALILTASATAVIVATEFIVIGLLPVLARDLGSSLAETGRLVGAFALSAAVLGPPLTLAATSQPPRRVLVATLLLFAAGNVAAVLAPVYSVMLAARIAQGAALPVFISVGAATVSALAPPDRRGRALALANTGFVVGVIVALPAGVALAEGGIWAPSFLALAALAICAAGIVATTFPTTSLPPPPAPEQQAALLRRPVFLAHLLLSVAVFAAMFAAYTYLTAWLEAVVGLDSRGVAVALAGFGAAGLIGNAVAGRAADQAPLGATVLAVAALALAASGVSIAHEHPLLLVLLFAAWGIAHTACVTLCQVRVTLAGGSAPAFAMAMNISAANLGIALGAEVGGMIVDHWGVDAMGWGALGLALVVAALAAVTRALGRQVRRGAADAAAH
jgi:DHA1 family inner membrane transport protein